MQPVVLVVTRIETPKRYKSNPSFPIAQRQESVAAFRLRRARFVAHNQVPPSREGQQEASDGAERYGEVVALPNPRWHTLSTLELGVAQVCHL